MQKLLWRCLESKNKHNGNFITAYVLHDIYDSYNYVVKRKDFDGKGDVAWCCITFQSCHFCNVILA